MAQSRYAVRHTRVKSSDLTYPFQSELRSIPNVCGVHELRLFSVSTSIKVASVHLVTSRSKQAHSSVQTAATKLLRDRHGYDMVTVQVERETAQEAAGCVQCRPIGEGPREAVS